MRAIKYLLIPAKTFHLLLATEAIVFAIVLVACAGEGYGGVEVNTGPLAVTVSVNNYGEFILDTNISIPLTGTEYLGVNLIAGYSTVLTNARDSEYKLYIIWQDTDRSVYVNEYDIRQKFKVTFSDKQIVRNLESTGDGSIVVSVDINQKQDIQDINVNDSETSCNGTTASKIVSNSDAYVCTKNDRLIVREVPGGSEILRMYPGEEIFVIDGPKCQDYATWWEISIPSGTKATVGQTDYEDYFYTSSEITGWVREGGDYQDPYYICQ